MILTRNFPETPLRLLPLIVWLIVAVLIAGCAPRTKTAAWVVRYDINTPQEVAAICQEARKAKFDSLLVQVRGRGDAFYESRLVPRAECLQDAPDGFDPLAETLADCNPIPIYAWLNVFYLWGGDEPPQDPSHPASPDNSWILHDANGRSVADYSRLDRALGWIEGIYADPASEEYRKLMSGVVQELLDRYPVKGIHLDFIRYPGAGYGQTGELGELYTDQWGIDPRLLPEITTSGLLDWLSGNMAPSDRALTTAALFWAELRATQVTAMVRAIREAVDWQDRGVTLSAAVDPDAGMAYLAKGQDWQTWEAEGLIDDLYPMAYFGDAHRVSEQLREVEHRQPPASPVRLWAGLGAYIKEPEQIAQEAKFARHHGYTGISLFSLGHLLRKEGASSPYAEAIAGHTYSFSYQQEEASCFSCRQEVPTASPVPGSYDLKLILCKAFGGKIPPVAHLEEVLAQRLTELAEGRNVYFKTTLARLNEQPQKLPQWDEMRGIFRYAHTMDSPAKWDEQRQEIECARQRVLEGENFASVAREISQGGSRYLGGRLGKHYLNPDDPSDQKLAELLPGETSPVIEVYNGYWFYVVDAKGEPDTQLFSEAPWPARRILFRQELAAVMNATPPHLATLHAKGH